MSYYMICPNCGKGTIGRYAIDNSLCGECSDNSSTTDKLSVEKLQEQLNTAKKALKEIQQLKRRDTTNLGMINKLQTIAKDALAAIGNEGSGDE